MTTIKTRTHTPDTDFTHNGAISALWKLGMNTADIAKKLNLREWQVANRLAAWRDSMHEVKE